MYADANWPSVPRLVPHFLQAPVHASTPTMMIAIFGRWGLFDLDGARVFGEPPL